MKRLIFITLTVAALLFFGCQENTGKKVTPLTSRIQYDVNIKSPDPEFDWWVQNIEGEKREAFLRNFLDKVYAGDVQAYDISGRQMSPGEAEAIGNWSDTVTIERTVPPYDLYDTLIQEKLDINDITRLRFMEEWQYDEGGLGISKRVIGICPILQRYEPDGSIRGYMPMFWVYFDDNYPSGN